MLRLSKRPPPTDHASRLSALLDAFNPPDAKAVAAAARRVQWLFEEPASEPAAAGSRSVARKRKGAAVPSLSPQSSPERSARLDHERETDEFFHALNRNASQGPAVAPCFEALAAVPGALAACRAASLRAFDSVFDHSNLFFLAFKAQALAAERSPLADHLLGALAADAVAFDARGVSAVARFASAALIKPSRRSEILLRWAAWTNRRVFIAREIARGQAAAGAVSVGQPLPGAPPSAKVARPCLDALLAAGWVDEDDLADFVSVSIWNCGAEGALDRNSLDRSDAAHVAALALFDIATDRPEWVQWASSLQAVASRQHMVQWKEFLPFFVAVAERAELLAVGAAGVAEALPDDEAKGARLGERAGPASVAGRSADKSEPKHSASKTRRAKPATLPAARPSVADDAKPRRL
jgi:hypothetical protein